MNKFTPNEKARGDGSRKKLPESPSAGNILIRVTLDSVIRNNLFSIPVYYLSKKSNYATRKFVLVLM